ncbi:MAG: T9SS type A sorting domain-containing protein, partial [Bacteroidales bacterium]
APGKCVLTLRNTLGELIQTTTIDGQSGKNSVNVDLSRLGQGIYVYTLEYKDLMLTRRLSVIK